MKPFIYLALLLLSNQIALATHLKGGYIQTSPVTGPASTYRVTAVLYMDEVSGKAAADQAQSVQICFGDGSTGIAYRASRQLISSGTSSINSYSAIHTYSGPNVYTVIVSTSNRTLVKNIPNADSQLFTLKATFSANTPTTNQTPTAGFPAEALSLGAGQRATLLLAATDAEGDSLVYGLAKAQTSTTQSSCDSKATTTYQFPNDLTRQGTFKINSRSGALVWDAPVELGYYSIAITIDEYRNGNQISQTIQELTVIVEDKAGTPGAIPPYEAAIEGAYSGLVTATTDYDDVNFRLTTFPNPVDDRLQVVIQTSQPTVVVVQLADMNGRRLHELTFSRKARQHEQVISMSSLTPGVYFVRADVAGRSIVRKVVKR